MVWKPLEETLISRGYFTGFPLLVVGETFYKNCCRRMYNLDDSSKGVLQSQCFLFVENGSKNKICCSVCSSGQLVGKYVVNSVPA